MEDWQTHPKAIDYYCRTSTRRVRESKQLLELSRLSGVTDNTGIYLEYQFLAPFEHELFNLREILTCDYSVTLAQDGSLGAWFLDGTTHPNATTKTVRELLAWVNEMLEYASSQGCMFRKWELIVADSGQRFSTAIFSA